MEGIYMLISLKNEAFLLERGWISEVVEPFLLIAKSMISH